MRKLAFVVAASLCTLARAATLPDDLVPIEPEMARKFGKLLSDEAAKIEKPQVKVEADPEKAVGVHSPTKAGLLVVPQKDLIESAELDAKFDGERGAPIANLFLYHISPVVEGKPADASALRTVTVKDDDGNSHTINHLFLAVKRVAADDYRLQAYGHQDKPIVDAKFMQITDTGMGPITVGVKDLDEVTKQGSIVITVFGKFQATFRGGHQE